MVFLSHLHDTGGAASPRPPAKAGLPGDFCDRQISLFRVIFDSCWASIIQLSGRDNWRKPTKSMEAFYSTCGYKVHLEPL